MKKIQIAICDDEEYAIAHLKSLLKQVEILKTHKYQIYTFTSSIDMFCYIQNNNIKFDIVYLDIELEKSVLGTNVGVRLKQINPDILLIYVSGYDCYYRDLVKAEPFYFLDKPVDYDKLRQPTENAIKRLLHINQSYFYIFKFNGISYQIDLKDVVYFDSCHRIVQIHDNKGHIFQFYEKLDNVERDIEKICPLFIRIHKSYYINMNYISNISSTHVCIDNLSIKVTPKYKDKFIKILKSKILK